MSLDSEIFNGKTLADMFADVYKNTDSKRQQINQFINSYLKLVRTVEDAAVLGPVIQSFLSTNVKNDEHIVRLVQIAQRLTTASGSDDDNSLLTEEEKQQLLKNVKMDFEAVLAEQDEIQEKLENS